MSLKVRLSKLGKDIPTAADQIDVVFNEIVWADGTVFGVIAQVRTAKGWRTLSRADGETDEAFRARAALGKEIADGR